MLSVHLSDDLVSGFGKSVREVSDTVRKFIRDGAVSVKIEDLEPISKQLLQSKDRERRSMVCSGFSKS